MMERTIGGLFSGIGGLERGLEASGLDATIWQVELDEFCCEVLAKHWPEAVRHHDVNDVEGTQLERVGVVCGGFPCVDISSAGKQAGIQRARSGLWFQMLRIIRELGPPFVVVENVSALTVRGLDVVLGGLTESGYDALWFPLRASDVGANHRRERIFIIAWRRELGDPFATQLGDAGSDRCAGRPGLDALEGRPESQAGGSSVADPCCERQSARGDGRQAVSTGRSEPRGSGGADAGMADANGEQVRQLEQRGEASGRELQAPGQTEPGCDSQQGTVAHRDGVGRDREPTPWLHDRRPRWYDAHRRHVFPPRPGDEEAWRAFTAQHGPQPGVRRGADGISGRVHRARLKALGNAVVPHVAEVVGLVVRGMMERLEQQGGNR